MVVAVCDGMLDMLSWRRATLYPSQADETSCRPCLLLTYLIRYTGYMLLAVVVVTTFALSYQPPGSEQNPAGLRARAEDQITRQAASKEPPLAWIGVSSLAGSAAKVVSTSRTKFLLDSTNVKSAVHVVVVAIGVLRVSSTTPSHVDRTIAQPLHRSAASPLRHFPASPLPRFAAPPPTLSPTRRN